MATNQLAQSNHEQMWAQAFIDYINNRDKTDYTVKVHNNNETPGWADVDIKATSSSGKFNPVYLQLTRDSRLAEVLRHDGFTVPVFDSDNILRAIQEKEAKYLKNGKDFSQTTLLIQGTMAKSSIPFEFNKRLINLCKNFAFKQIYYISAPKLVGSHGVNHFEDWLIIPLKP
jgi:hypothetical protein